MPISFLIVTFIFKRNNLQDHKASENHDFAVRDDFLVQQKTLQGNEPAKFSTKIIKNFFSNFIGEPTPKK